MTICLILQHKAYSIVSCRLLCKTVKTQCKQTHRFISRIESIFLSSSSLPLYSLFYRQKTDKESVNIFSKIIHWVTHYLSTLYKTYCFAFQKRLFCTAKAQVLHRKTAAFAMPNRNYRFSYELSLQNGSDFKHFLDNHPP